MADNPLKYSDLIQPDKSIENAISQLKELNDIYSQMSKSVKDKAISLSAELKNVSGATESGRSTTRKAASDADKLEKAYENLRFAYSDTAKKIAELNAEKTEQSQIDRLLAKINSSAEGSYKRLSAQYSLNKIYINNMTKAEREEAEAREGLITKTRELYEEMKRLQEETGKHQLNVGNYPDMSNAVADYGNKLKEVLGLNNSFGDSILSLAQSGESITNVFGGIRNSFAALGKTISTLITNPLFLSIAGVAAAGAAFKWWYNYNKGLVEATRLTQQFTGKEGDDLKAFRNEVQAVADAFNVDFNDTLIAANAMVKQFGISVNEAMQLIQDGFVAGANVNGEFLDIVREYPAYFKEAGISAEGFIAITTQAAKEGIFSDKGVDTIKEANLRLREMTTATATALDNIGISSKQVQEELQNGSKTTFEVMQQVSERLSELPDDAAVVGAAIANIFGGPGEDAGLQYIRTLKDISVNLDEVKQETGVLGQLQEEQLQSQIELENTLSGLFDQTGGNFETMTTNLKTFINRGLIILIKWVVNLINYFIDLYNESLLIRAIWNQIVSNFKNTIDVIVNLFKYLIDIIKTAGRAIKALLTLDFDGLADAWTAAFQDFGNFIRNTFKDISNNMDEARESMQKKVKPITIPVVTDDQTGNVSSTPKRVTSDTAQDTQKPSTSKSYSVSKSSGSNFEAIYKKNLEARRKYEDAQLALEKDGWDKRRRQTELQYSRQIEDLRHQLDTEANLNKEGREAINATITSLEYQKMKALEKLNNEQQAAELKYQQDTIKLRLDAVEKGSEEENRLRIQQLELSRKQELLQNSLLAEEQKQDEADINAKYNKQILEQERSFYQTREMALFDQQQALNQSEFDLLETTEEEKTRFKLQAERDRLQKLLDLAKNGGQQLRKAEMQTYQNQIAKLDKEIKATDKNRDIYDLLGIKLNDDQKKAISESVDYALGQLQTILETQVQIKDVMVQNAQEEVDAAQNRLEQEIEARNNGYANDVDGARKELQLTKKREQEALREREKAQRQQLALDSALQASSLITASAEIWKSFAGLGPFGIAAAIAAIATMWASFAASKIKAAQLVKVQNDSGDGSSGSVTYGEGGVEILEGGSHQSGNDIDLGRTRDGRKRRAEGGEAFAIINKRSTRKYRKRLPGIIKSINNGTFEKLYLDAFDTDGVQLNVAGGTFDSRNLERDVREIKEQGRHRFIIDKRGRTIEIYKNLKRVIS